MTYKMSGGHIGHTPTTGGSEGDAAPGVWQLKHIYPKSRASGDIARNWPLITPIPADPVYSTVLLRLPLDGNLTDFSSSPVSSNDQATDTFVTGKFGQGLAVSSGYVEYATGTFANTAAGGSGSTHSGTLEFWIKNTAAAYGSTDSVLLELGTSGSTNFFVTGNAGNLKLRHGTTNNSGLLIGAFTQNAWHHVLLFFYHILDLGGGSNFWHTDCYLDGTKNNTSQNLGEVPNKFSIGGGAGVASSHYIDDVRITKGAPRYSLNNSSTSFTVPTTAHATS